MKKILLSIILLGLLVSHGYCQEANDKNTYHFVFQMDENAVIEMFDEEIKNFRESTFDVLREKADYLAIKHFEVLLSGENEDIFIVSYSDVQDPNKIIEAIEPDKLPIPLKLITSFRCIFTYK